MEVCLWSSRVSYQGNLWILHGSCQASLEASVMKILSYFWSRWLMFQIEDDTLMGSRLDVIGVNEDNGDDNDIYIIPFFQRTFQFLLSCSYWKCPFGEGEGVINLFFRRENIKRVNCTAFSLVVRFLNDTLNLEKLNLMPVSVFIHPIQFCCTKLQKYHSLTQTKVFRGSSQTAKFSVL